MNYNVFESQNYYRISINDYKSIINLNSDKETEINSPDHIFKSIGLEIRASENQITILLPLELGSHILGLGERAFKIDRKRKRLRSINLDPHYYSEGKDPLYCSIPFFLKLYKGRTTGVFLNYPGDAYFDFGVECFDKITILIPDTNLEFYIFKSSNIREVTRNYIALTGKPLLPPKWAIGHMVSRHPYFPGSTVKEVVENYKKIVPMEAVFLDIDYMNMFRIFTWDKANYGDQRAFIEDIHNLGSKVITIIDPSVKADQEYDVFREGIGSYVRNHDGTLYVDNMFPGKSVFPDFFNIKSREFWKNKVKKWVSFGVDGIWLDMNEPTIFNDGLMMPHDNIHILDDGRHVRHSTVRNAYSYFEAMATYEAFSEVSETPFILTRAGFSGIQKYAAIWTGDNNSSWDDLKLQISMTTSLSLCGLTTVGCDIGGFNGDSPPDLIAAYYRTALFFPLFRNHNEIGYEDQEVFLLPRIYRDEIINTITTRYDFIDYIYDVLWKAHSYGCPSIAPIPYFFQDDEETYSVNDQYMVGEGLMYAPDVTKNSEERTVYLPNGKWLDFWTHDLHEGPCYVNTKTKNAIFLRENSYTIYKKKVWVFGTGVFSIFYDGNVITVKVDARKANMSGTYKDLDLKVLTPKKQ